MSLAHFEEDSYNFYGYFLLLTRNLFITLLVLLTACASKQATPTTTAPASAELQTLNDARLSPPLSTLDITNARLEDVQATFEAAGFVNFATDGQGDDTPMVVGYHQRDNAAVGISGGDQVERVRVVDFSGGQEGMTELALIPALFAPSASVWLQDQIARAQADAGHGYKIDRDFGAAHISFEAYNGDDGRELSVSVEPAP